MKTILITGKDSQLAQCLKLLEKDYANYKFIYTSSSKLDITDNDALQAYFQNNTIDYCINCAAYTAVEKAEDEPELARQVNTEGPKYLALACRASNAVLIHISTDFVFDGKKREPYIETDKTNPLNVYGLTKRNGENEIINHWEKHYIIRTSWLYSQFGTNFVKTMLRLSKEQKQLLVVNDQIGSPTYALDLANSILEIIRLEKEAYGIYHYSNKGNTSWYGFAKSIFGIIKSDVQLEPVLTVVQPRKVNRPRYSVLSTEKIEDTFGIKISDWNNSLKGCLKNT